VATSEIVYSVPGIGCAHCEAAIVAEVGRLADVAEVAVDLDARRVAVSGDRIDDRAVRAAIAAAGYEAER